MLSDHFQVGPGLQELHFVPAAALESYRAFARGCRSKCFWSAVEARLQRERIAGSHRLILVPAGSARWPGEGLKPRGVVAEAAQRCGWFLRAVSDESLPVWPSEIPLARLATGNPSFDLARPLNYTDRRGHVVRPGLRSADLLLRETRHARVFLDLQARPLYVVSPVALARRPGELPGRMRGVAWRELWRAALPLLDDHEGAFEAMELNVGAWQNLPHVHLKMWVAADSHEARWRGNSTYRRLRALSAQMPPLSGGRDE